MHLEIAFDSYFSHLSGGGRMPLHESAGNSVATPNNHSTSMNVLSVGVVAFDPIKLFPILYFGS